VCLQNIYLINWVFGKNNCHSRKWSNALGAYSALQSEEMMGFDVVAFFDTDSVDCEISSLPVIKDVKKF
jgi:hypothetical protein